MGGELKRLDHRCGLQGTEIEFDVPDEGKKRGVIMFGEWAYEPDLDGPGAFLGYRVGVASENCEYGSVFEFEDGTWRMCAVYLV